jgi:hypothetical protein
VAPAGRRWQQSSWRARLCRLLVNPHQAAQLRQGFPFAAKQDIRFYLNGVNIRPLDDGSVMVVASDGQPGQRPAELRAPRHGAAGDAVDAGNEAVRRAPPAAGCGTGVEMPTNYLTVDELAELIGCASTSFACMRRYLERHSCARRT